MDSDSKTVMFMIYLWSISLILRKWPPIPNVWLIFSVPTAYFLSVGLVGLFFLGAAWVYLFWAAVEGSFLRGAAVAPFFSSFYFGGGGWVLGSSPI